MKKIMIFLTAISFGGIANAWFWSTNKYSFDNKTSRSIFISTDSSKEFVEEGEVVIDPDGKKPANLKPGATIYVKTVGQPFASTSVKLSPKSTSYTVTNIGTRNAPKLKVQ